MKRLKHLLVVLLALMMVLSVAACRQDPVVTTPTDDGTIDSDPVSTTTKPTVLDIDLTQPWHKQINMSMDSGQHGAFSDVGYYCLTNGGKLSFMDTANGVLVPLCYNAGCAHDDEDCDAYLRMCRIMFYSGDHIYYNKRTRSDAAGIHIYRRNADGTGEEKIAVLGQKYAGGDISLAFGEYLASEKAAYFTAYISQAIKHEDGSVEMRSRDMILVRLDLKTGEQEELGWFADTQLRLLGCRDDALLYYTLQLPFEEDIFSDDYDAQLQEMPSRLRVWSGSTGGSVTLLEKPFEEFSDLKGLHDGKLLYGKYGIHETWGYDLGTGVDAVYDLEPSSVLVNENYIVDCSESEPDEGSYPKLRDLRTGKYIVSEFDDAGISVKNVSDRGMIIEFTYYGTPYVTEMGYMATPILRTILAYVSFGAIEDGLQKSDLMVISDKVYD